MSKLFTSILNKRLLSWSDLNSVVIDAQPGSGTRDAIFVLYSLISKTLREKKRLNCRFIAYRKASDSIQHNKMLMKYDINGKLFNVIKSMYSDLKSCVKMDGHFSEYFSLKTGLMQDEALSLLLFSLFINDLEKEMVANCCNKLELQNLNLFLLLFADDIVIFSEA